MGNLVETTAGCSLVSVQGNGEVCVQSVKMICILCMYREACIYGKSSLQAILYVWSIGWLKVAWPDLQYMNLWNNAMKKYC